MALHAEPDFENLFPPLTASEFEQLKENIKQHADLIPPIVVWGNYKKGDVIVDGVWRLKAYIALGMQPKTKKVNFEMRDDARRFAIAANIGRRNLDENQRALAVAELGRLKHGGPRKQGKKDQVTHKQLDLGAEERAKLADVSPGTVRRADKVRDQGAEDIVDAVRNGQVSLTDAVAIVDLPKKQQTAALKKVKSGKAPTLKKATDFDPVSLERQVQRRSGKEKTKPTARKECLAAFGKLEREITKAGLRGDCETHLKAILAILKG